MDLERNKNIETNKPKLLIEIRNKRQFEKQLKLQKLINIEPPILLDTALLHNFWRMDMLLEQCKNY